MTCLIAPSLPAEHVLYRRELLYADGERLARARPVVRLQVESVRRINARQLKVGPVLDSVRLRESLRPFDDLFRLHAISFFTVASRLRAPCRVGRRSGVRRG